MNVLEHQGRVHAEAMRRRRATAVVATFVRQFDGWHRRSALIFGLLMAGHGDREKVRADLTSLASEVRNGYDAFRLAIENEPHHSRIDDIDTTFRRLLQSIESQATTRPS